MCYKYATPKLDELVQFFGEQPSYDIRDYVEYYFADCFVQPMMPITTIEEPHIVQLAKWGLVPSGTKDADAWLRTYHTYNAISEEIFEKRSYKGYVQNRCLIWVNGFYEWQWMDEKGKNKIPYFIYMPDQKPFTFGGVYSKWVDPETGEVITTFSVITTEANEMMSEIHNNKKRMPFIVTPENRASWLGELNKEDMQAIMNPLPDGILKAHTISKLITKRGVEKNVPEIQEQYTY